MLLVEKCLEDVANAWPEIAVGEQNGSLKIGPLLIQWGHVTSKQTAKRVAQKFNFPIAFSDTPAVFTQCVDSTTYPDLFNVNAYDITNTKFTMGFMCNYSTLSNLKAVWIAIGKA